VLVGHTRKSPSAILEDSRGLTRGYKYLAALEVLDEGLALYPNNSDISEEFKRNTELYIMHQISNGYHMIESNPNDVEAYISISRAFLLMSDRFKALEILTEGTFENPHSPELWQAISEIELSAGRTAEASSALSRVHVQ
jgi:tetratricopeptide (TPR) repeat protein